MTPGRGRVLVRKVETAETYTGGAIILPESVREQISAQQVEVLAVGEDPICTEDACEREHWTLGPGFTRVHPCQVTRGAWALVAPRSFVECGDPTDETWLVRQDDLLAILTP